MWLETGNICRRSAQGLMESPTASGPTSRQIHHSSGRKLFLSCWLSCLIILSLLPAEVRSSPTGKSVNICSAVIKVLYREPLSGRVAVDARVEGRYGLKSPVEAEHGRVIHLVSVLGRNDGCYPAVNVPPGDGHWIALVQRGGCRFADKIFNAAFLNNASAVVVYDDRDDELITMNHEEDGIVSVFIEKAAGEHIANLTDSGLDVFMNISLGDVTIYEEVPAGSITRNARGSLRTNTSVLVVSICIIIALICGLVGLLVYGIRRSRHKPGRNRTTNPGCQRTHTSHTMIFLRENVGIREGLLEDIAEEQAETASTDTNPSGH